MTEQDFITLINRYFNYGYTGRKGKVLAYLSPAIAMHTDAGKISNAFTSFQTKSISSTAEKILLKQYNGVNNDVTPIGEYLYNHLKNEIAFAIIHGSIATGEENNYSDFDGLIILKNNVFEHKTKIRTVAKYLNNSYKMMLQIDPHQHHGWMILAEKQLQDWPCSFFPPAILKYSVSFPWFNSELKIECNEESHYDKNKFIEHCNKLINTLDQSKFPTSVFKLKSLLSEFMLTPALYLQTKTKKGVFKKNSFAITEKDFDSDDFQVMSEISLLRNEWPHFKCSDKLSTEIYFTPQNRLQQIKDKQKLPESITKKLNSSLSENMATLLRQFKLKIS